MEAKADTRPFSTKLSGDRLRRDLAEIAARDARTLAVGGRTYVNFASNDYLGLRFHAALIGRACDWARAYGTGSGASRLVTGNLELFADIEAKVAALKNKPAALLMASGFQANAACPAGAVRPGVLGAEPLVYSPTASTTPACISAVRPPACAQVRYRHCDVAHLAELWNQHARQIDRPEIHPDRERVLHGRRCGADFGDRRLGART